MRVVVFGYHSFGHAGLEELLSLGADMAGVVTHADSPTEEIWWPSVEKLARSRKIPVLLTDDANAPQVVEQVRSWRPEMLFSFYFRHLLSDEILKLPSRGAFNAHGSLLPKYRGRVPTHWALIQGETETGVTLHEMVRRADAGAIVAQVRVPIAREDTARTLMSKQVEAFRRLMRETVPLLDRGTAPRIPQDERLATKFGRRTAEDGRIDWTRPARAIENLVRAVTHPYPGAFTTARGKKLFIWKAREEDGAATAEAPGAILGSAGNALRVATGGGVLRIERAQTEENEEISGAAVMRELTWNPGERFGS